MFQKPNWHIKSAQKNIHVHRLLFRFVLSIGARKFFTILTHNDNKQLMNDTLKTNTNDAADFVSFVARISVHKMQFRQNV